MTREGEARRTVKVGNAPVEVTEAEWLFATSPPGTPVEWECRPDAAIGGPPRGTGILLGTYYWDGVHARVSAGGRTLTLCPALDRNFRAARLDDTARLNEPLMHGDGI